MIMMTNSSDDDGDDYNIYYSPVWIIVDDKEMTTTGRNLSILYYH